MSERPCRCLLRDDASQKPLYELVAEYVSLLAEDERVSQAEYEARLALCAECGKLRAGTCALCGCYAEMRAAKRRMSCPDVPPRWKKA